MVSVTIAGGAGYYSADVRDNLDGTFDCSYVPRSSGALMISVTLNGEHIRGSPYSVVALNETDAPDGATDSTRWSASTAKANSVQEVGLGASQHEPATEAIRIDTWDGKGLSYGIAVDHHVNFVRDQGVAYQFTINDEDAVRLIRQTHSSPPGSFPDTFDLRNSPASFDQVNVDPDGDGSGSMQLAHNFASLTFTFLQPFFHEVPKLRNLCDWKSKGSACSEFKREPINTPLSIGTIL